MRNTTIHNAAHRTYDVPLLYTNQQTFYSTAAAVTNLTTSPHTEVSTLKLYQLKQIKSAMTVHSFVKQIAN